LAFHPLSAASAAMNRLPDREGDEGVSGYKTVERHMKPKRPLPLTVTEKLNFQAIPDWLNAIAARIRQYGYQTFLVGGAVRDLLTAKPPHDWDLATDALPDEMETIFPGAIPTGKQYVTVLAGTNAVEITTFREDLEYQDGRRPIAVRFSQNITDDLARRDFTVNAIAYNLASGMLIDPFDGRNDLRRQVLKAVGNPATRFQEDGLRMLRFYRFIATLDFKPDRTTAKAINPVWANRLSPERLGAELTKLLTGAAVAKGLQGLQASGLMEVIIPELSAAELELGDTREKKLWRHLLLTVETIQPQPNLRWAALLHDVAKPVTKIFTPNGVHFYGHAESGSQMSRIVLERLRFSNSLVNAVSLLIRWHMFALPDPCTDAAIRRLITKVGVTAIPQLLELRRADIVASGHITRQTWETWQSLSARVTTALNAPAILRPTDLAVDGHDLLTAFKLQPGPTIGKTLQFLLDQVIETPELNQKETLLQLARNFLLKNF
jgi:tRNA nucleotidyltransferase (CCA-adding enzyme)